jgi:hypothetical protein
MLNVDWVFSCSNLNSGVQTLFKAQGGGFHFLLARFIAQVSIDESLHLELAESELHEIEAEDVEDTETLTGTRKKMESNAMRLYEFASDNLKTLGDQITKMCMGHFFQPCKPEETTSNSDVNTTKEDTRSSKGVDSNDIASEVNDSAFDECDYNCDDDKFWLDNDGVQWKKDSDGNFCWQDNVATR